MKVVGCCFDGTVEGVKERGVEGPKGEFRDDVGEVKCYEYLVSKLFKRNS